MNSHPPFEESDRKKFDSLLLALSLNVLSHDEKSELERMIQSNPEARDRYLDYISVDAQLAFRFRKQEPDSIIQSDHEVFESVTSQASWQKSSAIAVLSIAASIALLVIVLWPDRAKVTHVSDGSTVTVGGWQVRPKRGTEYDIVDNQRIRLTAGEFYLASAPENSDPLRIETPAGLVRTTSARIFVSHQKKKDIMNGVKPLVRLFVLAGAAALSNSAGEVNAVAGEFVSAVDGEAPEKLHEQGNYRDAYDIYKKLVVDPNHTGQACADDLERAIDCLWRLGRTDESDDLIEQTVKAHDDDWRVIVEAAERYWHLHHAGVIIANKFVRGGNGGQPVDVTERDRIRSLQLLQKAMPLLASAKGQGQARVYSLMSQVLQGGRQLWNLQTLTNIDRMPDIGEPVYWSHNASPPVDEEGKPIFYSLPNDWQSASNDGERWRWLLDQRGKVDTSQELDVRFEYADFLHGQFGVHTSGAISNPVLEEGQLPEEGRYTSHTLADNETIARLATGIRRFGLPNEQNYLRMYADIATIPLNEPPNPLRNLTCRVYAGDWNKLPDFSRLQPSEQKSVESRLFDLRVTDKTEYYGIVFDGSIEIPKNAEYKFDLWSDDGTRLIINGRTVIENDGTHGMDHKEGKVKLAKGTHSIKLEFFQKNGPEGLIMSMRAPGVPRTFLSHQRHSATPQERATEKLAYIYENRRQFVKAAELWRENIERFSDAKNRWKEKHLEQIAGNWVRFDNAPVFPAGKKARLAMSFRNATGAKFRARKVRFEQFIADAKNYLRSDPKKVTDRHHIFGIGQRIVAENEKKYLEDDSIEWTRSLSPPKDHWTGYTEIETPLDKTGVYLVEATANDGNTSRVLCWITDTTIVMKRGDSRHIYFVADASTGKPVAKANVEVFAYWARWDKQAGRNYTKTVNFARFTDQNGFVFTDASDVDDQNYHRVVVARDEETGRFGILGDFFRDRLTSLDLGNYQHVKAWCLSDRPVYRPGQSIHLKSWVRLAKYDLGNATLFGGREFNAIVVDPSGKELLRKKVRTDEFGGLTLDLRLEEEAMLGNYHFKVEAENFEHPFTEHVS